MTGARAAGDAAHGVVTAFDATEGLGVVRLDDGGDVGFHATQLADGTRTIDVGRSVDVVVVPWHRGRLEAAEVLAR